MNVSPCQRSPGHGLLSPPWSSPSAPPPCRWVPPVRGAALGNWVFFVFVNETRREGDACRPEERDGDVPARPRHHPSLPRCLVAAPLPVMSPTSAPRTGTNNWISVCFMTPLVSAVTPAGVTAPASGTAVLGQVAGPKQDGPLTGGANPRVRGGLSTS